MTDPHVLCLGEILFDCLADQPGLPLEEVQSWTAFPGGAPANVACALVKLGTPASFIGCVGRDEAGRELVNLLQAVGVDDSGVQYHPTAPTRSVYVVRSETGDRSFAGFGDRNTTAFADTHLQAEQLPTSLFEVADFLVTGTLELAYPDSRAAIQHSLTLAKKQNVEVLVDVNWRPVFWPDPDLAPQTIRAIFKQIDFLKLSEEEADWLFSTQDPGAIARQLDHLKGVLITAGEKGCAYWLRGNAGQLPAFSIQVADTTGSGDGFVAGFLHQLCQQGLSCLQDSQVSRQVVRYASAVGALTATKSGAIAAQPTAAEVDTFLGANPE